MEGWVKLHRKLMNKSFYRNDSETVHLWIHLLISANHIEREEIFAGKPIICKPGQFTTGRNQLVKETGINRSKIERILKKLEKIEHQIEQRTSSTNRLISIINWHEYQDSEQLSEQQVSNKRATSEQQVSTPKELKNIKNERIKENIDVRKQKFALTLIPFWDTYGKELLNDFYKYWTEPNKSNTKFRQELEKTWDLKRRIETWAKNDKNFKGLKQPDFSNFKSSLA
jgi:hypothetical protein